MLQENTTTIRTLRCRGQLLYKNMVQVNEDKLAELIRKANKYDWLKGFDIEDMLSDYKDVSMMDYSDGAYYQYDDMPICEIIENELPYLQ